MDKIPCTGNDGTGNQWLEFDSVRMHSNLVLVAIYKKCQNFQNCQKIQKFLNFPKLNFFSKGFHKIKKLIFN